MKIPAPPIHIFQKKKNQNCQKAGPYVNVYEYNLSINIKTINIKYNKAFNI